MKENQSKIIYMIKCINPDINIAPAKYFDTKEEAEQEAIKMEYWVLKKYLKLDDVEFMRKFAKKFWMDNFKIVAKAGPVIINTKDKIVKEETMNLREEIKNLTEDNFQDRKAQRIAANEQARQKALTDKKAKADKAREEEADFNGRADDFEEELKVLLNKYQLCISGNDYDGAIVIDKKNHELSNTIRCSV